MIYGGFYSNLFCSSNLDISMSDEKMDDAFEVNVSHQVGAFAYATISGNYLDELFRQKNHLKKALILDVRGNERFITDHVKNSYNIPFTEGDGTQRFTTKADVVGFFLDQECNHTTTINLSGHFDEIILYDDQSNNKFLGQSLNIILQAIIKWNEDTKTHVWYLNGGYSTIKKDFPHLLISTYYIGSLTTPHGFTLNGITDNQSVSEGPSCLKAGENLASTQSSMRKLDESIIKINEMTDYERTLEILEGINFMLKEEETKILKEALDGLVDDHYKCEVCKDVFSGMIFQCGKGHDTCQNCLKDRLVCPVGECQFQFHFEGSVVTGGHYLKNRNIFKEKLMATCLSVYCPNGNGCNESLMLNQVSCHVVDCVKMRGPVGRRLDEEIHLINGDIQELKRQIMDTQKRKVK